jgi:two-component system, LytTR family, response regulator
MTALIIDDEADARLMLKQYLSDFPQIQLLAECTDGLGAVAAIDQHEPDLIFLDIQMPGLSGFQVLQRVVHVPQVIFCTAFDRFALKAFDHNAIDYLLKPYTRTRFAQAVNKVLTNGPASNLAQVRQLSEHLAPESPQLTRLLVEQGHKMIALAVEKIVWIEADGDYTRLHTAERFYLSSSSMTDLEQKLPTRQFLRIHRSAIVNTDHLRNVERDSSGLHVCLSNGLRHKVSRSYQDTLKGWMV